MRVAHSRHPVSSVLVAAVCQFGIPLAAPLPVDQGEVQSDPAYQQPMAVALDHDVVFEEVTVLPGGQVVAGDAGGAADGESRLIYSNTLSIHSINFPTNQPISDDITTTAPDGCNLKMFKFKVLGRVLPQGDTCSGGLNSGQSCTNTEDCPGGTCFRRSGPFTVKYALYTNCPLALGGGSNGAVLRELIKIPGTTGEISFLDDAPRTIKHVIDPHRPVPIPTNIYLGLQFSRSNCGTVVGAPAMVGFSGDIWDFPGLPCNGFLGGFPQLPHASFWAEIYADATCPASFPGYKNSRPSGGVATFGMNVQGFDDVHLQVKNCQVVGYEVVVKGVGFYTFDLRRQCDGQIIEGTQRTFSVNATTVPLLQVARFPFDPPIALPDDDLYFGFKSSSNSSGVVISGIEPVVGQNGSDLFTIGLEGCSPVLPVQGVHGAVNLGIICAGTLPTGACCDMALLECQGGPDAGKRCPANALCVGGVDNGDDCSSSNPCESPGICSPFCASPGTCESLCREVPQMNCPWPPKTLNYVPWGGPTLPLTPAWVEGGTCQAPPFGLTCGLSACCKPDDTCENLTKNECDSVIPTDRARIWQGGNFCEQENHTCPFSVCLAREGSCTIAHELPGCDDPSCCEQICEIDSWCCHVDWDRECVRLADQVCEHGGVNQCSRNARWIQADSTTFLSNSELGQSSDEPGFCCNALDPGSQGYGTTWFKFVATDSSVQVDTCESDSEGDSLINVFAVGDSSTDLAACNSLSLIGCGDDGCGSTGRHSKLCVDGLTPGATYFIMLSSKSLETEGTYQIQLKSPAQCESFWVGGDCNENGRTDGCDLVDGTSADCDDDRIPDECEAPQLGAVTNETCVRFGQTVHSRNSDDWLALNIAMTEEWLLVSDPTQPAGDADWTGQVYVYRRSGNVWVLNQILMTSCSSPYCQFGSSVAVSDSTAIVVGVESPNSGYTSRAYIFHFDEGMWRLQGEIGPPLESYRHWVSVRMDGDVVALAALSHGYGYECSHSIVVFTYRKVGQNWQLTSRIPEFGSFGECDFAMDLHAGVLAISSEREYDNNYNWIGDDSIQVFEQRGPNWTRTARFAFPEHSLFPSISVRGNRLIGAGIEQNAEGRYISVGHVFSRSIEGWQPEFVIRDPDAAEYFIAHAVAMCHGGLAAMVATGSDAPCTHILFSRRASSGLWEEICDFPFPSCFFASEGLTQLACAKDVAAIAVGSSNDGSVFTTSIPSTDCDGNLVPDSCDLAAGTSEDCNQDFTLDQCTQLLANDGDFSGRIDLHDIALLQSCFAGAGALSLQRFRYGLEKWGT